MAAEHGGCLSYVPHECYSCIALCWLGFSSQPDKCFLSISSGREDAWVKSCLN